MQISKSMMNFLKEMTDPQTGVTTGEYVINNFSYSNCFSGMPEGTTLKDTTDT